MTHFKLSVIRTDGIQHESTFGGWHAETAAHRHLTESKEDKRTIIAVLFEGVQSDHSSDIKWYPRQIFNNNVDLAS